MHLHLHLSDTPRKRFPPRKRGRKPKKKRSEEDEEEEESSAEASQQNDETIVDKPEEFETMLERPDKVPFDNDFSKMSFSDDDMDMNVEFDLGVETGDNDDYDYADDVGEEHDDDDGGDCEEDGDHDDDDDDSGAPVERMDLDTVRCSETKDQRHQMDLDVSGVTTVRNAGKVVEIIYGETLRSNLILWTSFFDFWLLTGVGSHLAAALAGMKEARVLLTKLDIVSILFFQLITWHPEDS